MTNLIPLQLDKDTGLQIASRSGLRAGANIPAGFFPTMGYIHTEAVLSSTWIIPHNADLTNYQIQVFDDLGNFIIPDQIVAIDANTIHVLHSAPITGKVVLTFIMDN